MLSHEELSDIAELTHNGEAINWDYWSNLSNITPAQAARLAHHIDPIKWPSDEYFQGTLPSGLCGEILRLKQWLKNHAPLWTLADLVAALGGGFVTPFGMIQVIASKSNVSREGAGNQQAKTQNNAHQEPWLIPNPNDPQPEQPWYVPARYFARELVKDDSTLLTKTNLLAAKVAQSLDGVGIKKRGGKKPLSPATIKKAFSNIVLR